MVTNFKIRVMGFNFNFFGTSEHRVFNYKPRYYDQKKEALKETFGQVDGSAGKKDSQKSDYTPGSYLKDSLRDGHYQKTRQTNKAQQIIGVVGLILFFIVLVYIAKFYSLLF